MADHAAIVLGTGDEIGAAVAFQLARAGFSLALVDSEASRVDDLKNRLADAGYAATVFESCLDNADGVEEAVASVLSDVGAVHALVNVACGAGDDSWLRLSAEQITEALAVSSRRTLVWSKCVSAHMAENQGGRIVSVVPTCARYRSAWFHWESEFPGPAVLDAGAGGSLLAVTRQLAFDLAPSGIRVNSVAVGLVRTAQTEQMLNHMTAREKRLLMNEISLGRLGEAEEVAAVVGFLCGTGSSYLTGTTIDVNGGYWMS